ncbi:Cell division protein FtsI/penicillin-binding protein 2 [Lachnospiraceae bacterium NLAE-zl-G231]|nr:Cell division protein FtsI/penicillin-binding protein 2 [Lachnospiraceae bacterium NLAE-zl-G231]
MRTKRRRRRSRRQRIRTRKLLISGTAVLVIAGLVFGGFMLLKNILPAAGEKTEEPKTPEELLCYYMAEIEQDKYEEMYDMLEPQSQESISREAFAERNRNIYQGIDAAEIRVEVTQVQESGSQAATVFYDTSMNTSAGEISFSNKVVFLKNQLEKGEEGYPYLLVWDDSLIFPELTATDKVKVTRDDAARGEIVDRSGRMLAGKGIGSSVGLVPGKMEKNEESDDIFGEETVTDEDPAGNEETPVNEETAANKSSDIKEETSSEGTDASTETNTKTEPEKISSPSVVRLAELLEVSPESIEKKLSAKWVKDDSFVPIKTIQKLTDQELMSDNPGEEVQKKKELQEALLAIPGVLITDVEIRDYPLGKAASHLTGYIQQVTAEDLEKHPGEGYRANSVIGRSGMELLYEKELKGQDGCEIAILNDAGQKKSVLAQIPKRDGQTIQLTIDAGLQKELYDTYAEDKSCSVAMDPFTGEVLALVSTPSFDSRDFIYGMSQTLWDSLNEDERMPLYNRFRQKLCPGSSFKPVIAAIGLETGAIDPDMDYGNEGLQWQKDASWGKYYVTTLHAYDPVILENALIYSDNIYFAKAALRIGSDKLTDGLDKLGFGEPIPFEISMAQSQYSNSEGIDSEIQLADSGYGQGEVLVNPLHLAALYTGFANNGNVISPYLLYKGNPEPKIWLEQAYTPEAAQLIEKGLIQVISSPHGTGYGARREDISLAGKTGTAEIKLSKDDTNGTELGWFCIFTTQKDTKSPILLLTMTEDVKGRGGSGYVVDRSKSVLNYYFSRD